MAKKKEVKKKKKAFVSDEELERMEVWGKAHKKLKGEREANYKKKKRKEKKEAKAKRDSKILTQDNAKRKAGQIVLKKIKAARQAVKDFTKMPSSESKGLIDYSNEASDIKKEFLKLEKDLKSFQVLARK